MILPAINKEYENMVEILKYHTAIKYTRKIEYIYDNIAKIDEFYFYIKTEDNSNMDVEYMSDVIFCIDDILYKKINKDELTLKLIEENKEIKNKIKNNPKVNTNADVVQDQVCFILD